MKEMVSRQANQPKNLRTSNRQIMLLTRKLLLFDVFGTVGSVAGDSGWRGLLGRSEVDYWLEDSKVRNHDQAVTY